MKYIYKYIYFLSKTIRLERTRYRDSTNNSYLFSDFDFCDVTLIYGDNQHSSSKNLNTVNKPKNHKNLSILNTYLICQVPQQQIKKLN